MPAGFFSGKVAIVTGASSGIGRATVGALLRERAIVVAASRNETALRGLQESFQPHPGQLTIIPTDVTDAVAVEQLVQRTLKAYGKVDIMVCSAGVYHRRPVRELTVEEYQRVMAVNFYGVVHCIRAVLPCMLERRTGYLVVVSSVDGKKGLPPDGAYVASKFAVTGLLDVLRQELHGSGVYASTILPARVDTPMIERLKVPFTSPKISSERVAKAILQAVERRKAEIVVPLMGPKFLILAGIVAPRLGDWLVRIFGLEGTEESL